MIQSSTKNSILRIYGVIQFTAILGMKLLSCPYFVTKSSEEQFPEKRATVFLRSDEAATRCTFLCGYAYVYLESPQTSMTAG